MPQPPRARRRRPVPSEQQFLKLIAPLSAAEQQLLLGIMEVIGQHGVKRLRWWVDALHTWLHAPQKNFV